MYCTILNEAASQLKAVANLAGSSLHLSVVCFFSLHSLLNSWSFLFPFSFLHSLQFCHAAKEMNQNSSFQPPLFSFVSFHHRGLTYGGATHHHISGLYSKQSQVRSKGWPKNDHARLQLALMISERMLLFSPALQETISLYKKKTLQCQQLHLINF